MQVQKNAFNVVLTSVGTNRLNVVKAVRDACGLGLGVANDHTKKLPAVIATGVSRSDAQTIRTAIEDAGGAVRIE
jgi:large subunit ribosomal protein L7/L12